MRIATPVSLRDLPATIVTLLGFTSQTPLPGYSLSYHWNGGHGSADGPTTPILSQLNFAPNLPQWLPVSKGNMKSLVAENYHYIKNGDGSEEIYDWKHDPWEKYNLASSYKDSKFLEFSRMVIETLRTSK
jgi:hypothetical protein